MEGDIELKVQGIRFPPGCVSCGALPTHPAEVEFKKGIDLIVFAVHQVLTLQIPLCDTCRRRRTRAWWTIAVGVTLLIVLFIAVAALILLPVLGEGSIAAIVPVVLVFLWLGRNRLDPCVDQRTIGLRGQLLDSRTGLVRLGFRRKGLNAVILGASDLDPAPPKTDLEVGVG